MSPQTIGGPTDLEPLLGVVEDVRGGRGAGDEDGAVVHQPFGEARLLRAESAQERGRGPEAQALAQIGNLHQSLKTSDSLGVCADRQQHREQSFRGLEVASRAFMEPPCHPRDR